MVKRALAFMAVTGVLVLGCSSDGGSDRGPLAGGTRTDDASGQPANLSVFITDAPPTFRNLNIVSISLRSVEALDADGSTTDLGLEAPLGQDLTVDLLPLKGGVRAAIAQGSVPPGAYRVRLTLSDAAVHMVVPGLPASKTVYDTNNGRLTLEGGRATGSGLREYVVEVPGGDAVAVAPGADRELLIDFDLTESLTANGEPGSPSSIVMTPIMRLRELAPPGPRPGLRPGSLRGVVRGDGGTPGDAVLVNALVTLFDPGSDVVVARTRTDDQGVFVIEGVDGGPWDLQVEQPGFTTFRLEDLVVDATTRDVLLARTE